MEDIDLEGVRYLNKENYCTGLHQLKQYLSEIGVYIISGLSEVMQKEILSLLGANICIDMLEEHMEGTLYDYLMEIARESCGDVILTNTKSMELIDSYIDSIEELSKLWGMRIYICSNDNIWKLNKLSEKLEAIAMLNASNEKNEIEIHIVRNHSKEISLYFDNNGKRKFELLKKQAYEDITGLLHKYKKACIDYPEIFDDMLDRCYEDICINKQVCNLMMNVNIDKYKKYECVDEKYKIEVATNIEQLWKNVLECDYMLTRSVDEIISGCSGALFVSRNNCSWSNDIIATLLVDGKRISEINCKEFKEEEGESDFMLLMEWIIQFAKKNRLCINDVNFIFV